ncbi:hypothetical protein GLU60_01260 [Nanohaloarchaea archaeon H01]|nr:hypothetical protein [Nanohaloarchaea archaeon H01]
MIEEIGLSLVLTSIFSATGALLLFMSRERFEHLTQFLISFSAGTIFGGVFIHLVFRLASNYTRLSGLLVVIGLVLSFMLERVVHWHCHHRGTHEEPVPYVLAAGDGIHNILDGILIATSFLVSISSGIAATVAVIAHKIPKELGDFGVMVDYGFSRMKALAVNVGISVFMFLGAGLVLGVSSISSGILTILLPLVIGNFVYIAGSDLLPDFKHSENWFRHLAVFSLGVGLMYLVPYFKTLVSTVL